MSKKILNKVKGAFHCLGRELTMSGNLYEFEYDHITMLLSIDEENHTIAFNTIVVRTAAERLNENILNTALDVVKEFHKDCCGDWNNGSPFFVSPSYLLRGTKAVTSDWLKEQLDAFRDAYLFFEANIHLICDSSMFDLIVQTDE